MKPIFLNFIALFSFGFIACQNHSSTFKDAKTFDLNSFSVTKELKGVSHTFNDEIMKPIRLQVYDSLLITINVGENKLLTVYNLNTYTKIGSRINLGDGPLEMFQPNFIKGDDKNISLYDMGKSTIFKYDISDFVHNADPVPVKQIKLSQNIFNDVAFDGEGNIIAPVYRDQSLFSIFNQNGEKVGNFGAYPESGLQMTDAEKREMFQFTYASNSNGKMALCYSWNDLIDIYNEEKQLACRIHGPIQFTSSFKEFRDGEVSSAHPEQGKQRDAYYNPVAADDVFFVLFNGNFVDDENYTNRSNQIFVFDWNGKPLERLILDNGIISFTVNSQKRKIYGISDMPEYHIVEFEY